MADPLAAGLEAYENCEHPDNITAVRLAIQTALAETDGGERGHAAIRTLERLGFTYGGGAFWLGKPPATLELKPAGWLLVNLEDGARVYRQHKPRSYDAAWWRLQEVFTK